MEIEPGQATAKGPAERFTGDVWGDAVSQTLYITEGIAYVQARGGQAVAVHRGAHVTDAEYHAARSNHEQ